MTEQEITLLVGNLQGTMTQVLAGLGEVKEKLDQKPCVIHEQEINSLIEWKSSCTEVKSVKTKADYSLRNTILTAIVTAILTALCTLAVVIVTGGVP